MGRSKTKDIRRNILEIVIVISLIGILFVYSASSIYAFHKFNNPLYYIERQVVFLGVSLLLFFIILFFCDIEFLLGSGRYLLILNIILLFLVLLLGKEQGGARRWFTIGGVNFQPSELLKISFPLYIADYFRRKKDNIKNLFSGFSPLIFISSFIFLLLLLEPDMGSVVFWSLWLCIMMYIMGVRKRYILGLICLGVIAFSLLIYVAPYRMQRILAFLNPWEDIRNQGFQLVQSSISYVEGGLWGKGLGNGRQKFFFLPAAHTDFILSIIAEEVGLCGVLVIIFLFFLLFLNMERLISRVKEPTIRLLDTGILFIFILQTIINMGVSVGIMPTKGMSLPFVSYGGSSLVINYLALGLFLKVSYKYESDYSK